MNYGGCPYDDCNHLLMFELPDKPLPVVMPLTCDGCGRRIWYKFSRVDPMAWTDEGFREEWEIDEETKSIKKKENR
jgi:hypothetical protein